MAFLNDTLERAAQIAAGCLWLGNAGGFEAGAMAAVAGVSLIGMIGDGLRAHGIESGAELARIRIRTREALELRYDDLGALLDIKEADQALAESLRDCFLDREALVEAALDPEGFPVKATRVIMAALAEGNANVFGDDAPEAGRAFAEAVVSAALWAAVENRAYFEDIQARLTFEQMRALGQLLEGVTSSNAKLDEVLRILRSQGAVERAEAAGLNEAQVRNLVRAFTDEDIPIESAEGLLLKAAEELRELRARLLRLSNDDQAVANLKARAAAEIEAGRLDEARMLVLQAAELDRRALEDIEEARRARGLSAAESLAEAARIDEAQARFIDAAILYGEAADIAAPVSPETASGHKIRQAGALHEHALIFPGLTHLNDAVGAYRNALEVYTRNDMPADWAMTQNNLGNALATLGARAGGEEGLNALNDAVEAYRNALGVYTRNDMPAQWAMTQNNLGNALQTLGARAGGEEGLNALNDAVEAFRNALEVCTRDDMPAQWAMMQNNLGSTLATLGERTGGEEGLNALNDAVEAFRNALEVCTRDDMPAQWAMMQNNLGSTLATLGERTGGEEGLNALNDAVEAFRNALEVCTRDDMPADWATTQNNLGNALHTLGERAGDEEGLNALNDAVEAFRNALEVCTRDDMPAQWAMMQNNLGSTLQTLGERAGDEEGLNALNDAVEAFRNALEVCTRDDMPADWATTQNNLGNTLATLGARAGGEEGLNALNDAVEAYRNALEVRTRNDMPADWAATQANLGSARAAKTWLDGDPSLLPEALDAMDEVIAIFEAMGATAYRDIAERTAAAIRALLGGDGGPT